MCSPPLCHKIVSVKHYFEIYYKAKSFLEGTMWAGIE